MDYRVFEQRVLQVLFTTDVPLGPAEMAFYAHVPVGEAEQHLERMVEARILHKECDLETGAVSYEYPSRRRLPSPETALVPLAPRPLYSPAVAVALSILLPGAGHVYSGRARRGIGWLVATLLGYACLVVPGVLLHILCIASAANVPRA